MPSEIGKVDSGECRVTSGDRFQLFTFHYSPITIHYQLINVFFRKPKHTGGFFALFLLFS